MPYLVNGQPVPENLIRQAGQFIARNPQWNQIADASERAARLDEAAMQSAIDRMLVAQIAAADPRPIDPILIKA